MDTEKYLLKIEGMHCVSCERSIGKALRCVPGVTEAQVSFALGEAQVECAPGTPPKEIITAIKSVGYNAHLDMPSHDHDHTGHITSQRELLTVLLSALLTLPIVLQMVVDFMPLWVQFALATVVQFAFGWRFYIGSYYALKTFTGNMDLLIGLGTSAAYFYSAIVFLGGFSGHTYFESSAAIITLILLGRYLESRTKRKASGAIQALLNLQPKQARVEKNGQWQEISIREMVVGDVFQVRPGENVPIDGVVTGGKSYVNESMLTGESSPVRKAEAAHVFGGTLNGQGVLTVRATAVGAQTALASIIRLVQSAQSSKAPIQNLADSISAIFVPTVIAISLGAFFAWWGFGHDLARALVNGVAVLVIACPCALGMATPTVIMVASGRGARSGILVKNAEALQKSEKLKIVAVDKTGTLTAGKPVLSDVIPDSEKIRQIAASLEDLSEHPIAQAIANGYKGEKAVVSGFEAFSGKGIMGTMNNQKYLLGSPRWMQEKGVKTDARVVELLENQAKTVVILSDTTQPLGYLAVTDVLRAHSLEGIELLQEQGLEVVMLTGDRTPTAHAIAQQVGITSFFAEILPQDKAATVERLKQKNQKVAMVGDGINDAPALAAADVGFAMRSGSDIALESADITLMSNDLRHVADAIDLAKATFRKIRQNLFFAFIYNILGIPLAALGLLNPMIAGGAMAASSLCVVINSLLLNKWKPPR